MGVSPLVKKEDLDKEEICPFHRLMFLMGHDQRLRDSTLRVPRSQDANAEQWPLGLWNWFSRRFLGREDKYQGIDNGRGRRVSSISRVDGNSLGIIFQDLYDDGLDDSEIHDRRRRRSFRFNAAWWSSLQKAANEPGVGDRIATWVTAGDDVVLAEYEMSEGETRPQGKTLRTVLESWARELSKVDELDADIFLSFGAGISIRGELLEKEAKMEIQAMMEIAGRREESSKRRWKSKIDSECSEGEVHPLLKMRGDLGKVHWEPEEGWEATSFVNGTRSTLVEEGAEGRRKTEEAEVDRFEGFEVWTEPLIEEILEKRPLSNSDEKKNWEALSRHYFEKKGDELTLVVLPEKQK
jgi:hypothetical protein